MDNNIEYMLRALELAKMGAGRVSPNPMVGAIIVKDNEIIGEGYHHCFGQDHAEVDAIKCCQRLGNDTSAATMYVTLEPCCHHGKTPPCTDAIIAAGISKVEIATIDDYQEVSGRGVDLLRNAGIEVNVGMCKQQARDLNSGFFKRLKTDTPEVILKWAQSIDGKLTFREGDSRRWFTGTSARVDVHKLRNQCDAIMVGTATCLSDDPMLNVRMPEIDDSKLKRVVLDANLALPLDRKLFNSPEAGTVYIMTTRPAIEANPSKAESLEALGCELIAIGRDNNGNLDLVAVLKELGRIGVCYLMVEGGAKILDSFINRKLADRIVCYLAPVFVGEGKGVIAASFSSSFAMEDIKSRLIDDDVVIEGKIIYDKGLR